MMHLLFLVLFALVAATACTKRFVSTPEGAVKAAEEFIKSTRGEDALRKHQPFTAMWGREADSWLVSGRDHLLIFVSKNGDAGEFVAAPGETFTFKLPATPKK